jgi:hypothetical protein
MASLIEQQAPATAPWGKLAAQRWGPALNEGNTGPGIVIPHDWRSEVASWPLDRWKAWRHRSAELLASLGNTPTATDIRIADRRAYEALVSMVPTPAPHGEPST